MDWTGCISVFRHLRAYIYIKRSCFWEREWCRGFMGLEEWKGRGKWRILIKIHEKETQLTEWGWTRGWVPCWRDTFTWSWAQVSPSASHSWRLFCLKRSLSLRGHKKGMQNWGSAQCLANIKASINWIPVHLSTLPTPLNSPHPTTLDLTHFHVYLKISK